GCSGCTRTVLGTTQRTIRRPPASSGRHDPAKDGRQAGDGTVGFFARLGASWPLTDHQRQRLAPLATAALDAGWDPSALAAFAGANTTGIRNPAAVLAARLSPTELPAPPG